MLRKVYISGAHSTGKTTLCEHLKSSLCVENAELIHFQEIGRKIAEEEKIAAVSIMLYS